MTLTLILSALLGVAFAILFALSLYALIRTIAWALEAAPAWWARNIIDADPNPEPSRLDKRDGL